MTNTQKLDVAKTKRNQLAGTYLRTNTTHPSVIKNAWIDAKDAYEAVGLTPRDLLVDCQKHCKKYTSPRLSL